MARMLLNNDQLPENSAEQAAQAEPADTAPIAARESAAETQAEVPEDRYANMFAEWDLLPPQVLIRRVTRK